MAGTQLGGQGIASPNAAPTGVQLDQKGQTAVYNPPRFSKPSMVKNPTVTYQPETASDTGSGTDSGNRTLTVLEQIDIEIQAAARKALDVANKKFSYSPYESPIYSIMRQEYMKEADLAAGRATAAAVQNAGGFGSSYATMAGEEARREVMEGFHDQEDELYSAAKSEFESEKQSYFDNYLQLLQLRASEEERLEAETPTTLTLADGTTVEVTEEAQNLYTNYYQSFADGTGYDTLKTAMINEGASEADADAAIGLFKKLASSTVTDAISELEKSPTLEGAAAAYDAAKKDDSLGKHAATISAIATIDLQKRIDIATTDEDEAAVLEEAGQAYANGYLTAEDYAKTYIHDIEKTLKGTKGDSFTTKRERYKTILDIYEDISTLGEQEQLPPEVTTKIVDWIVDETDILDNVAPIHDKDGNVTGYNMSAKTDIGMFSAKKQDLIMELAGHKLARERILGIQK